ncbi:MAG TPA: hypothetical protein VM802_23390 [Chitinophaga sp.]|uniref:hypothetical protein n=1 Tax=Chitinophaga sp. TaxID=1869181 RepID=UPI002BCFFBF5|nr:hypothetical protein [Chitinophaga sp.]HVI47833.1 hypothetical protein [Chitinophaga sp.]
MDKKTFALLKQIYNNSNSFYNLEASRHEHRIPADITAEDIALLESKGYRPNHFYTLTHDEALARLLSVRDQHPQLPVLAAALFVKGITGEYIRGRQTLMSYLYVKHLSPHSFTGTGSCVICGLPAGETIDFTEQLYRRYDGHSWNELPLHFLPELEEAVRFPLPELTVADKAKLTGLLTFIAEADNAETPGKLEKRIAAAKLLPLTDKYKRYGILQTLAECGILPNQLIPPSFDAFSTRTEHWAANKQLTTSSRSDIILPLGGWKGAMGVNFDRYHEIFDVK